MHSHLETREDSYVFFATTKDNNLGIIICSAFSEFDSGRRNKLTRCARIIHFAKLFILPTGRRADERTISKRPKFITFILSRSLLGLSWLEGYLFFAAYTDRQRSYAQALGQSGVFTPQLIVEGRTSVVGSNASDVKQAIARAKQAQRVIDVSLMPDKTGHALIASMNAKNPGAAPPQVDLWEVHFDRYAKTQIGGGENGGRTLESINNVTSLTPLGTWRIADGEKTIPLHDVSGGAAIIVQAQQQGSILGAASYMK